MQAFLRKTKIRHYFRGNDCLRNVAMSMAKVSYPFSLIWLMQAARFELKINEKTFEMALLNFLQSFTLPMLQSAQLIKLFSILQLLILHHEALTFSAQPGHLPIKYDLHAPQYNPQNAISFGLATISF
jgi:hypothetical protein